VIPQDAPRLACLDARTGDERWRAPLRFSGGHLVVAGETVLVGGWRGYHPLTGLDLHTGEQRWQAADREALVVPVVTAGGVLLGQPGSTWLRLVDPADGRTRARWELPEPLADADAAPAITALDADRVAVRCGPRSVVEVSVATGEARVLLHAERDLLPRAVDRTGDVLWAHHTWRGVVAFDARDGRVLHELGSVRPYVDRVVQVDAGFVVAADHGLLLLVHPDSRQGSVWAFPVRRIRAVRPHGPDTVLLLTKGTLRVVGAGRRCAVRPNGGCGPRPDGASGARGLHSRS
jgi:outer membrane protein assembly factor BamB